MFHQYHLNIHCHIHTGYKINRFDRHFQMSVQLLLFTENNHVPVFLFKESTTSESQPILKQKLSYLNPCGVLAQHRESVRNNENLATFR